jgi:hypothetical protein
MPQSSSFTFIVERIFMRRTHCLRGHLFTPENTYVAPPSIHHPKGLRQCLECKSLRHREYMKDPIKKAAASARGSQWAKDHPEIAYEKSRRSAYAAMGWSVERFDQVLKEQDNKCAICDRTFDEDCKPHADHKHGDSPIPRGILCGNCNRGIGNLREDPAIFQAALSYLAKWNGG